MFGYARETLRLAGSCADYCIFVPLNTCQETPSVNPVGRNKVSSSGSIYSFRQLRFFAEDCT